MDKMSKFKFPSDLNYIFIEPISFFWVKKVLEGQENNELVLKLGFPELITANLVKSQLKFGFRSENLNLREGKPFLRLLTKNKLFEFIAPFKCAWSINPKIKNNDFSFLENPYEEYVIKCFNIENPNRINSVLKSIQDLEKDLSSIIKKEVFEDCKDCPDLFQGSVVRRMNS